MNTLNPTVRREDLLLEELPTELLVYDQKSHRAHCLNASAAAVFKYADGSRTITEIARAASKQLGTTVSEDLAWVALEELDKNDLLETALPLVPQGPSRRAALMTAGAATAVLVPLVLAIIAPTPAYAQSVGGSGATSGAPVTGGGPGASSTAGPASVRRTRRIRPIR